MSIDLAPPEATDAEQRRGGHESAMPAFLRDPKPWTERVAANLEDGTPTLIAISAESEPSMVSTAAVRTSS